MNMYINQSFQVKWNNIISSQSHVSYGVKQGGCLSPTLISVYLNELIETLRKNNIGCRYGSEYMGVFCYADDLSLLCPSFTGIKEMLKTCEDYAMKHNILFNAKKIQMLTFDHKSRILVKPILKMKNGDEIPYVTECNHLGNILSSISDIPIVDHAVNDIYKRTNCLLADFSFTDSKTLSRLFNTYCTNIYGSPLWKHFDRKLLEPFYIAWRKCIRRVWKIPFTSHNVLLPYIHNTIAFNVILEKRCITFLWTLFNSGYDIYRTIIKNSLHNRNTTLGENVRYFMHKYNIVFTDWFENINILYNKIDIYVKHNFDAESFYVGNTIRELCEARDNCCSQFFEQGELLRMIDMLCTK